MSKTITFDGVVADDRKFKYAVKQNNNANIVIFKIKKVQDSITLNPENHFYVKVKSNTGQEFFDKDSSAVITTDENYIFISWTMLRKHTQFKNIDVQIQYEDLASDVVWQTEIVNIDLFAHIPADEEIENLYPSILSQLQAQIDNHDLRITELENRQVVLEWGNIQGNISLQTDLVNFIDAKILIEKNAREQADSVLSDAIGVEEEERKQADNELEDDILMETQQRESADSLLLPKANVKSEFNDTAGNTYSVGYLNQVHEQLKGQNEFIGEMESSASDETELIAELNEFDDAQGHPRKGDIVNVVGGQFDNQQWYRNATTWVKYLDIHFPQGTIDTNISNSLPIPASPEDIHSSINLHKVSKTGKGADLVDFREMISIRKDSFYILNNGVYSPVSAIPSTYNGIAFSFTRQGIWVSNVESGVETNATLISHNSVELSTDEHSITVDATTGKIVIDNVEMANVNLLDNNVAVIQNQFFTYNGDAVSFTLNYKNLKTGQTQSKVETLSLADSNNAGLMSPATVQAIQQMRSELDVLEGQSVRLVYTIKSNPTASEIAMFVIASGYSDRTKWTNIGVVVRATNHIWRFYTNSNAWEDIGIDTVNQFTNSVAGIILGSTIAGRIYAEDDGTGSVYGWDALVNRVSALENDKQDKLTFATEQDIIDLF